MVDHHFDPEALELPVGATAETSAFARRMEERALAAHAESTSAASRGRWDEEAELSVLGAGLLDPDVLPLVAGIVRADEFYHPSHGLVFEAMSFSKGGESGATGKKV